ncbi:MAG: hypothetical protein HZB29_11805 [Nitrospinae bacterium]|nr:hypothetical protein [Nitrospinota bacterium]
MALVSCKFAVNDKLVFRLSPEQSAESFTCLVKKIKDRLVAIVVSNKDKSRVNLAEGDTAYLFSDDGAAKWVTPLKLAQRQTFPLMIFTINGEPSRAQTGSVENPPAPMDQIESIDTDLGTPAEEIPAVEVRAEDETPKETFDGKMADTEMDRLDEMVGVTIRELESSESPPKRQETMPWNPDMLEDISEIDTSELEAELNADIEEALAMEVEAGIAPPEPAAEAHEYSNEDDLKDMRLVHDRSFELGELDTDQTTISPPKAEQPAGQEEPGLEVIESGAPPVEMEYHPAPELMGGDDAYSVPAQPSEDLYVPESADGSEQPGTFHDYFGLALTWLDDKSGTTIKTWGVCATLSPQGALIATDNMPPEGARGYIEVERAWAPRLKFSAVGEVESSFGVDNATFVKLRFTALSPEAVDSIRDYLENRMALFRAIRRIAKD